MSIRRATLALFPLLAASAAAAQPLGSRQSPPRLFELAGPARPCESLVSPAVAGRLSTPVSRVSFDFATVQEGDAATPSSCRVVATVNHPPDDDRIQVFLAFPLESWNGRFLGTGGGGFFGGGPGSLAGPLKQGYAVAATDTGHVGGSGSFALGPDGRLDWMLIRDNAYLGIHEMTRVGKALTEIFYGREPGYSYFSGCSTGGRQGLMEAQRYPGDYDGILSGAPAINWNRFHVAQMWGQLVQLEAKNYLPECKFERAREAAIEACDAADGVSDGVLRDPRRCRFDPAELVGTTVGGCSAFSRLDAEVVREIWRGPRRQDGSFLWYGLTPGASFWPLSGSAGEPPVGRPMSITLDWFRYFLARDRSYDTSTLDAASYEHFWDQSLEQFGDVIGTDDADLGAFQRAGGKVLVWHGWADSLIYPQGTIDYVERVFDAMGGREATSELLRLFMAPGVEHCGRGPGPGPDAPFDALVRWVEQGQPPETLLAARRDESGNVVQSRPLCLYPLVAHHTGGSQDLASSFECR